MKKRYTFFINRIVKEVLGEIYSEIFKSYIRVFTNKWTVASKVPTELNAHYRQLVKTNGLVCIAYETDKKNALTYQVEGKFKKGKFSKDSRFLVEIPKKGLRLFKRKLLSYPTRLVPSTALWIGNHIPINVLTLENNKLSKGQLPEKMYFYKISPEFITDEILEMIKIRSFDGTIYIEGDITYDKVIMLNKNQFNKKNTGKVAVGYTKIIGYATGMTLLTFVLKELALILLNTWMIANGIELPELPTFPLL